MWFLLVEFVWVGEGDVEVVVVFFVIVVVDLCLVVFVEFVGEIEV